MGLNGRYGALGGPHGGTVHGAGGRGADEVTPREIRVDIGELALDGFNGDPDLVLAAFQAELARLVREHGVPLAADGRPRALGTLAGLPPLPATVSAGRLGEALARSVHAGLAGQGESGEETGAAERTPGRSGRRR